MLDIFWAVLSCAHGNIRLCPRWAVPGFLWRASQYQRCWCWWLWQSHALQWICEGHLQIPPATWGWLLLLNTFFYKPPLSIYVIFEMTSSLCCICLQGWSGCQTKVSGRRRGHWEHARHPYWLARPGPNQVSAVAGDHVHDSCNHWPLSSGR